MNEEQLKKLSEEIRTDVDAIMEKKLPEVVGATVAAEVKKTVQNMRLEKAVFGRDRSGLDDEQKKSFVSFVKSVIGMRTKANEEMIEEQDNRGGYLVPKEVATAIQRIAASVGLILNQAQHWPMKTDELDIPAYTGSFLEGEYLGVNAAGSITAITFGQAKLISKKWQLAFVVGNDLMDDSNVALAEWLLALSAEALANMIDKQGFAGTGSPFTGILNDPNVTVFSMPTGETTFSSFDPVVDGNDMIANLDESLLPEAAWYIHRTVWAKYKSKKDTAGNYIIQQAGMNSYPVISANAGLIGGIRPVGEMNGYPVFTVRHLPTNSATAVSTKFMVFGNLKAFAYGDRGDMRMVQAASGTFGNKEVALADQTGMVMKHRHALTSVLPAAFVVAKTAAS